MRKLILATAVALVALPVAPALAVPDCATIPAARTILDGQGVLESVAVQPDGALFYSDLSANAVMRLDRPGATPATLAAVNGPGGLLFEPDGHLIAGQGNGTVQGATGPLTRVASLLRIDPSTGATSTIATGLQMSNGVARGPDGSFYASDDSLPGGVDRVSPDGTVTVNWANVTSANGLVADPQDRWVYAAQTFQPAAIQRVSVTDPSRVEPYATTTGADQFSGPDGMTSDAKGNLYVAINGAGEVWKVTTDRRICALARGLNNASMVAFGGGGAFPRRNLYVTTFLGKVVELQGVR
jgi:sugar lactone lactonase YvrE